MRYNIISTSDITNVISGRWIDMTCGKYLAITALCVQNTRDPLLHSKDGYRVFKEDLFPPQEGRLEGIRVQIPRNYRKLVVDEYGLSALEKPRHHW